METFHNKLKQAKNIISELNWPSNYLILRIGLEAIWD